MAYDKSIVDKENRRVREQQEYVAEIVSDGLIRILPQFLEPMKLRREALDKAIEAKSDRPVVDEATDIYNFLLGADELSENISKQALALMTQELKDKYR